MLAKKFRLPAAVFRGKGAQSGSTPCFLIKIKNNSLNHNRFGVVIPLKSLGKSTERHHWKRRLLDALNSLPNTGRDFLIIVSPKIKGVAPAVAAKELELAVGRLLLENPH